MIPIPIDKLETQLNKVVHVRGMRPGCQFHLIEIDGHRVLLKTPKTRRSLWVAANNLLYSHRNAP